MAWWLRAGTPFAEGLSSVLSNHAEQYITLISPAPWAITLNVLGKCMCAYLYRHTYTIKINSPQYKFLQKAKWRVKFTNHNCVIES